MWDIAIDKREVAGDVGKTKEPQRARMPRAGDSAKERGAGRSQQNTDTKLGGDACKLRVRGWSGWRRKKERLGRAGVRRCAGGEGETKLGGEALTTISTHAILFNKL